MPHDPQSQFDLIGFSRDPVHGYIKITTPGAGETAESDLLDSKWLQRLRRIHQLQTALWVYPSGEHTRFQHVLGAMHLAGIFTKKLYPSLAGVCDGLPSENYLEELMRLAALLHDVGHGPFGHFFDDQFLHPLYGLNHELIGQKIITSELGAVISKIQRSPSGTFRAKERISPEHVAFLIKRPEEDDSSADRPKWLSMLRQLFSGIYTVDNMDFVLRDSYMCGINAGPVDVDRLMNYTFFTKEGLTLHKAARSALKAFMMARQYLFDNVYYHRTGRALDLQLREIFQPSMRILMPFNPAERLDAYCELTDWSLLTAVSGWGAHGKTDEEKTLGKKWLKILSRDLDWKEVYDREVVFAEKPFLSKQLSADEIKKQIIKRLPASLQKIEFEIDIAQVDPRPDNPFAGPQAIRVYDPHAKRVGTEYLEEIFGSIPSRVMKLRIYARSREHVEQLREAANKALRVSDSHGETNM
jgi:HD superfamily phosphohydrolase